GLVSVAGEEVNQCVVIKAPKYGRIRDFVAVQMKERNYCPVACRIQKLVGMPTRGEWSRLTLAVTNHAASQQVGIVKDRAVGVHQRIAKFPPFMDRAGCFRSGMTGNSSRK